MFRSLASSLLTFVAILLFAFTILFLWTGSQGIEFKRIAMEGDQSTLSILEQRRREALRAQDVASNDSGSQEMATPTRTSSGDGPPVVVWISIPGFRSDYLEKAETPFFDELASNGSETNKMRPSFPCLTYPAHATMVTGVTPDIHGIVGDKVRVDGNIVEASDPSLLGAEAIWTTATRQGIKTLVHDWPLSQSQSGEHAAASFLDSYDPEASDQDRLNAALEAWRAASGGGDTAGAEEGAEAGAEAPAAEAAEPAAGGGDEKFRLVMLRLNDIFKAGLTNGPRTDETYAVISATDAALKSFFDTIQAEWSNLAPANANLVMLVTTDHGMAELDKNVNVAHLLGEEMMANADIVAHDAVANLFFKDLPESEGEKNLFIEKFDGELSKRIYFRTLKKEELPDSWSYLNEERTGDRVLVLKTGYAFSDMKADEPVFDPSEGPNLFGGFGYPVEDSSRMSGQIFLAGFPNSPLSGELDEVSQLSFHASVCKMLGIEPAEGAATETLPLK